MPQVYNRLTAAIKAAADSAGGLLQIMLGNTGSIILYPPAPDQFAEPKSTGKMWDSVAIPQILQTVGAELDTAAIARANIFTGATGNIVQIYESVRISSIVKDEANNKLTVSLNPVYANAYYVVHASLSRLAALNSFYLSSTAVGSFEVRFYDASGLVNINSQYAELLICGTS
jgi:hypothetical protein